MGTDRSERTKPCPCKKGSIRIVVETPDHPWISSYNVHYYANIECPICALEYAIDGYDASMRIVRKSDVAAQIEKKAAYDSVYNHLQRSDTVRGLKTDFRNHLVKMKSVAEIYRYLSANGFYNSSLASFRKDWKAGAGWEPHLGAEQVSTITKLLGCDRPELLAALSEVARLRAEIPSVPTVMGRITEWSFDDHSPT